MKQHLVQRKHVLSAIEQAATSSVSLVLGGAKTGKTTLVKQLDGVYVDVARMSTHPECFVLELLSSVSMQTLGKKSIASLQDLLGLEKEVGKGAYDSLLAIDNELQKIKPNNNLLLRSAFSFIEQLQQKTQTKPLIFDHAHGLLELTHFHHIDDVSSYFPSSLHIVLVSHLGAQMRESFSGKEVVVQGLTLQETQSFLSHDDAAEVDKVHALTKGNPYVLSQLKGEGDLVSSFVELLLVRNKSLHAYCEAQLVSSIASARGQALLKSALKVISQEDLRLSEIARRMYRSAPVTKSVLQRLMDADVIVKSGKTFAIADPVFGLWLKLVSQGYEFDTVDTKLLSEVEKLL